MLREEVTQSARTLKASSFAHIEPSPLLKIAACDTTPLPRSELSMYACQLIHLREKILTHSLRPTTTTTSRLRGVWGREDVNVNVNCIYIIKGDETYGNMLHVRFCS